VLVIVGYLLYILINYLVNGEIRFIPRFISGASGLESKKADNDIGPTFESNAVAAGDRRTPIGSDQAEINAPLPDPDSVTSLPPPGEVKITKEIVTSCPDLNCDCPPTGMSEEEERRMHGLNMENQFLKDMIRFVASIAKRENGVNMAYAEQYPGVSVHSAPRVQALNIEYNQLKRQFRRNPAKWNYFKTHFTNLTGIPSKTGEQIL
jgi:hypothetical protein